jgi:hypothetical protein
MIQVVSTSMRAVLLEFEGALGAEPTAAAGGLSCSSTKTSCMPPKKKWRSSETGLNAHQISNCRLLPPLLVMMMWNISSACEAEPSLQQSVSNINHQKAFNDTYNFYKDTFHAQFELY